MQTIENGQVVESDLRHLDAEEPLPQHGTVTVPLERWIAERDALVQRGDVGVRLQSFETAEQVAPYLRDLEVIALEFPKFADGRHYSTARLLRDKFGFTGQLRATGDVLRDQLFYLVRCGFDVLELRSDKDAHAALDAFRDFSVTYQAASDGQLPIYRR